MSVERKLVAITPTFQAVLNKQLAKVTDALDSRNPIDTFVKMRTLIMLLNPEDQKELLDNHIAHIQQDINQAMTCEGVDLYTTRRKRNSRVKSTLRSSLLELFRAVMVKLHTGGYLEKTRDIPKGRYRDQ